jgi:hypothetical protein
MVQYVSRSKPIGALRLGGGGWYTRGLERGAIREDEAAEEVQEFLQWVIK